MPVDANLIDFGNDGVSPETSWDPTPRQSASLGTSATSPQDPLPVEVLDATAPLRWTKGDLIGAGAFGKVYIGLNQETGHLMAVKQVHVPQEAHCRDRVADHVKALESEVEVLKRFNHENIVRYLGTERRDDAFNIFLEYAAGGSVASLLSRFGCFEETLIRVFTRQILKGLEFLHQNMTAHRDIKGANILVDHQGVVKLADFGASKSIEHLVTLNSGFKSLKGTPFWMAPEVIKQTGHGRQADIWSVGCTVIEMATGKPPWSDVANNVTVMFHIASATEPPPIPEHFSHEARDFLRLCFNRSPKERPNASRLLLHPFVAQQEHLQATALTSEVFPSLPVDAAAEIDPPLDESLRSRAVNLLSQPSSGMTLTSPPGLTPETPSVETTRGIDTFVGLMQEELRQDAGLKAQWANELQKELRAMKDQRLVP